MFCSIFSAAIAGVEAVPVWVETDVSDGMPLFNMVGYITQQVREAQDRVRTALRNVGISLPPKRITISLSPGDLRKEGTRFDLPIAASILLATGAVPEDAFQGVFLAGELHLDGRIAAVNGILPSVIAARSAGCTVCLVPRDNLREGRVVQGIRVVGLRSLAELLQYCRGELEPEEEPSPPEDAGPELPQADFRDIRGQAVVKRAALIAASGFHNLLLSGPPGSGKSMTARRIPTILPKLSFEESLEISRIYSIVGLLPEREPLLFDRPFRAPHHTISPTALCGGGYYPRPGEVTLAHRGVLFLDEMPEIQPATLEMLRQPLEDRSITVSRMGGTYVYPASFLLVAAMNPCPCGYYPDMNRCTCTPREILNYRSRVSQALLDRIDLRCDVPAASYKDLNTGTDRELSSEEMRGQVTEAAAVQQDRFRGCGFSFNSEIPPSQLRAFCPQSPEAERTMKTAFDALGLSARGYHRILRVSRTIADLDHSELITEAHVYEALCCRCGEGKAV